MSPQFSRLALSASGTPREPSRLQPLSKLWPSPGISSSHPIQPQQLQAQRDCHPLCRSQQDQAPVPQSSGGSRNRQPKHPNDSKKQLLLSDEVSPGNQLDPLATRQRGFRPLFTFPTARGYGEWPSYGRIVDDLLVNRAAHPSESQDCQSVCLHRSISPV